MTQTRVYYKPNTHKISRFSSETPESPPSPNTNYYIPEDRLNFLQRWTSFKFQLMDKKGELKPQKRRLVITVDIHLL